MSKIEIKDLIPYFNYLFDDINWNYNKLSRMEKEKISLEIFEYLKDLRFNINKEYIKKELELCKNNPYYFATTYLKIIDNDSNEISYKTNLSEIEFNKLF